MTDEEIAEFRDEVERSSARTDMIAAYRDSDMWVPAYRCPKCGRWAHVEAGNDNGGKYYWMVTDCVRCGRYECRGGSAGTQRYGRDVKVKQLSKPGEVDELARKIYEKPGWSFDDLNEWDQEDYRVKARQLLTKRMKERERRGGTDD
jgi:hypothetical protein